MIKKIKEEIKNLFENTPKEIGVMYGKKITNNEFTDEKSIVFLVPKKKPISELNENEILPKEVVIDGLVYKTDVIECSPKPLCDPQYSNSCYDWQVAQPPNMDTYRPLLGGIEISSVNKACEAGTLGFIAVDIESDALVGVTNNHVVVTDPFYTLYRNLTTLVYNEIGNKILQSANCPPFSPPCIENWTLGGVVRYVPLYPFGYGTNYVDGALISVHDSTISNETSWQQLGLDGVTSPPEFATTAEIDDLLNNPPSEVWSAGRTTGAKQGICGLSIYGLGASLNVGPYGLQTAATGANFEDLIAFTRIDLTCPNPIYPGDSGSALIAVINGVPKIIGLVFAGSEYTGWACRIDRVAEELSIKAWDGTPKRYIAPDSIKFVTVSGGNTDKTLLCSGETYWQMGLTRDRWSCQCQGLRLVFTAETNTTVEFEVDGFSDFDMSINWGDGNTTTYNGNNTYTPTHVYTNNASNLRYVVNVGFNDCSLIQSLKVQGSPIKIVPLVEISGLENLTMLENIIVDYTSLQDFQITYLYGIEFPLPNTLKNLIITNNIDFYTFTPFYPLPTSLINLILNNNSLSSFNLNANVPVSLSIIDISNNRINNSFIFLTWLVNAVNLNSFYAQNNLLSVNEVNLALTRMASATYTSIPPRNLFLNSQTPLAPPSGAGITAKITLISNGWIVNTD